ncbi:MAG: hypothetical protein GKR90_19995 [Pseudomonadales bacterium]|nr:hypothetical protein [Pseudomonadales bacterium]
MLKQLLRSKFKPKLTLPVSFVLASLVAANVYAAPGGDRFPIDLEKIEARSAAQFRAIDSDSDGEVDLAEFEAAPAPARRHKRFRQGNRRMQGAHHKRLNPRNAKNAGSLRESIQSELFELLDQDSNGQLSANEFANSDRSMRKLARQRATFKHLDADQNGVLVPSEMPGRGTRLSQADANNDGKVTREELRSLRATRAGQQNKAG